MLGCARSAWAVALGLTQPNPTLPSSLGFSLCVCLLILCVSLPTSAWLWLSLSCLSVAFLLSDLADLGPGPFLPGADPSVSVFCVAGCLGPRTAGPAECAPQDLSARGHPSRHCDEDSWCGPGQGWQVSPQAPAVMVGGVQAQLTPTFSSPDGKEFKPPMSTRVLESPGHQ